MSDSSFISPHDLISRLSFGLVPQAPEPARNTGIGDGTNEMTLRRQIVPVESPTLQALLSTTTNTPTTPTTSTDAAVERISEDVSALILSHLSLTEIAAASETCKVLYRACRSNQLWKTLFEYRWNVKTDEEADSYFAAYQRAHWYPHDLWVTHWNVVYPAEGLSPGRCCIRPMQRTSRKTFQGGKVQCPTCRDYHSYNTTDSNSTNNNHETKDTAPQTAAQKEAQRTFRLCQRLIAHGMKLPDLCAHDPESQSEQAFRAAATFHRELDTSQYRAGSATHFLTDLVFFNLTDPYTAQGSWELEQLLTEAIETPPPPTDGGLHLTSHHSWHILELRNADLYRPILYQFGVQRPDCFAVYPSEGLIEAGCSIHVTVGVTPLGSALAFAFEGLDILRDGLPGEWASLYTAEAHLPLSPFLLRYRFADIPPAPAVDARRRYVVSTEVADSKEAVLEHHFQQDFSPHHFRTIYVSAHVNSHYNFWDFFEQTCQPWIVERRQREGPIWIAPVLAEKYTRHWRTLDQSVDKTLPFCRTTKYTEGPCEGCGLIWEARDEELVHEYFAAFAIVFWYQKQRKVLLQNVSSCIEVISTITIKNEEAVSTLLYSIFCIIQGFKASQLINDEQRQKFTDQESVVDELCRRIRVGGETWIPWRRTGVYRHLRCTDSVFGGQVIHPQGKDEPAYLDAFRHLTHCPGGFCLGRQVDPNHVTSSIQPSSRRFIQKQGNLVSDIFMDDPISALQAGICMLHDPRSLLLHGVYDRIRYPGSVVRRPRMSVPHFLPHDGADTSIGRLASYGLLQFVHDVPPPGVGRFAISTFHFHEPNLRPEIIEVKLTEEEHEPERNESLEATAAGAPAPPPPLRPRPLPMRRGPRFVQMLWTLGASLGLVVIDSSNVSSVFVDRTILIATHWISISLMIAPLLITLTARYAQWIPAQPVDYNLDGLPFSLQNEMRFLTESECGLSAILLLLVWMALGRWSERHTYRDLFRAMLEHLAQTKPEKSFIRRRVAATKLWLLRRWDGFCPLFLQRRVFSPHWNLRSKTDLIKHLAFWRSRNLAEHRSHTSPLAGHQDCFFGDSRDCGIDFGLDSSARKIATGIIVVLASFCASSPHFWLNLTTVFSSSVSLGISISVQSLEKGRPQISLSNTGSFLRELNLLTVCIGACLVGQLVGSSGGTMFLAEFIVTSISLVLGGAGTVSASAMESWFTFFVLAWTSFWGYLFGRVGLIDGILLKRRGYSTALLSTAVALMGVFWTLVLLVGRFDSPVNLVIFRPSIQEASTWSKRYAAKMLQ